MNFPSYETYENVYELVSDATDCKNPPKMRRREEPRRVTRRPNKTKIEIFFPGSLLTYGYGLSLSKYLLPTLKILDLGGD